MNTISMISRGLIALVLTLAGGTAPAQAAPFTPAMSTPVAAGAPQAARPVFAQSTLRTGGLLQDVIGNRARLIQVSFIFVIIGIFILWWKK